MRFCSRLGTHELTSVPPVVASKTSDAPGKATETAEKPANDKPSGENEDSEMSGTAEAPANSEAKDNKETEAPAPTTAVAAALQDKSRRKSAAEYKGGKKLNKKGSKARITNLDAEPGNLYTVKLKGYPPWPAIICDEEMIPTNIRFNRPVTAKRVDGTYREDFADGGRRAHDRSFAVMYLYTNELYVAGTIQHVGLACVASFQGLMKQCWS